MLMMILSVLRSPPFKSVIVLLLRSWTVLPGMTYTQRVSQWIELLVTPIEHRRFPERFTSQFVPKIGSSLSLRPKLTPSLIHQLREKFFGVTWSGSLIWTWRRLWSVRHIGRCGFGWGHRGRRCCSWACCLMLRRLMWMR